MRIWNKHGPSLNQLPMKKTRSAADMYKLWPSRDWFSEGELPFKDWLDFAAQLHEP